MKSPPRSIARFAALAVSVANAMAVFAPRSARADDVRVRVSVKRAADAGDCPDAAGLAAAIGKAGNRAPPETNADAEARLRFDVAMARSADGFRATVSITGARIGVREIAHTGATCGPLADAVAVSLVVVIDDVEQGDANDAASRAASGSAPGASAPVEDAPPATTRSHPLALPSAPAPRRDDVVRRDEEPPPSEPVVYERTANNSFFVELGGSGLFYTFDYEHVFGDSNLSFRLGFGFVHLTGAIPGNYFDEEDISVPIVANYYIGKGSHKVQLGFGTLILDREPDEDGTPSSTGNFLRQSHTVLGTMLVGYRYLPLDGGFDFGVAFTPCFGAGLGFLPWAGVNFGVGF